MKNKCTLLIDGNWLLQSRVYKIKGFEVDNPDSVKQEATHNLVDLMARSINVIINRFKVIDNILLVSDERSWRLSLPKPNHLKDVVYKGTRSVNSDLDWKYIWNALNTLSNNFKKLNITYCRGEHIEGDDWIWYWSTKLNAQNINCIIWSSDNDLKQLVSNVNNTFTVWYNDRNGLTLHESFQNDFESPDSYIDMFINGIKGSPELDAVKKFTKKREHEYIDPNNIILEKIICGDKGDNIQPVISWRKGERNYHISGRIWEDISNKLNIIDIFDFQNRIDDICKNICNNEKIKKYIKSTPDVIEEIKQNILYNIKMVWLHKSIIPEHLQEVMSEVDYQVADMKFIRNNFKLFSSAPDDAKDMINEVADLFSNI